MNALKQVDVTVKPDGSVEAAHAPRPVEPGEDTGFLDNLSIDALRAIYEQAMAAAGPDGMRADDILSIAITPAEPNDSLAP